MTVGSQPMARQRELDIRLTIEEANVVLEGLGLLPFAKVYALIHGIQAQARAQLNGALDHAQGVEGSGVSDAD